MRKFIFLVAFFLTMSFGINSASLAHAETSSASTTMSASDTAQMNETLLGLQERLLLLQAQSASQTPAVQQSSSAVSQSVTQMQAELSAQDIASLTRALGALTNA